MRNASTSASILLYDSGCALCSRSANFVAAHDRAGRFWYAGLTSARGRALLREHGLEVERLDSVVLIDGDAVHTGSAAVIRTARLLGKPWSALSALRAVPAFLREPVYRFVARNRHRLVGGRACPAPHPRLIERLLE